MKQKLKKIIFEMLLTRAKKVLDQTKSVIGVTGSVGKTSTRMAIATVLSERWRVQTSSQNFNTPMGLLLSILNIEESGYTVFSWTKILFKIFIHPLPNPQILVLEFGVDAPGDMLELLRICTPYTAVLTPITLAHSAKGQFSNVSSVRAEKIQLAIAAKKVIANDGDEETAQFLRKNLQEKTEFFGESKNDVLEIKEIQTEENGISFFAGKEKYTVPVFGHFQAQVFAPAILLGLQNGLSPRQVQKALFRFSPSTGRGRILKGKNGSTLWDFSYNSSPAAAKAVLESLEEFRGFSRKIAVLGTMNELGDFASEEHEKLGMIAAKYVSEVIFVGNFSEEVRKGINGKCPFFVCKNAKAAGKFLDKKNLRKGDLLVFKGSQNGVFLEEAIKEILENPEDTSEICRQTKSWQIKKREIFS